MGGLDEGEEKRGKKVNGVGARDGKVFFGREDNKNRNREERGE